MNYRALFVVTALGLAGCSGGGTTTGHPCPALGVGDPGATLVSPAKGATGVPVTVGTITFTVTIPSLRQGTVTLSPTDNSGLITGGPVSTDRNNISSSVIPTLRPAVTYTVTIRLSSPPDAYCSSFVEGDLGTFTTQ